MTMKKILFSILCGLLLMPVFAGMANAQLKITEGRNALGQFYKGALGKTYDVSNKQKLEKLLPAAIGNIISIALSMIAVILLVIIVYAGFLWLTAGGNEDQVGKAKKWIKNGVIGLIISLSAFLLTSFVVQRVQTAVQSGTSEAPAEGETATKVVHNNFLAF